MHICVDGDNGLVIIGETMKNSTTRYTERTLFLGNTISQLDRTLMIFLIELLLIIASTN